VTKTTYADPAARACPPRGERGAEPHGLVPGALAEVLQRCRRLLYDLHARLTYFAREVRVTYAVDRRGELRHLRQGDYRLQLPHGSGDGPLSLAFCCRGEGPDLVCQVEGTPLAVEHLREYLARHGLRFKAEMVYADAYGACQRGAGTHVAFYVAPFVPVSLAFDVERETGMVRLTACNLDRLGRLSYRLRPESVNQDFFGELFKAIAREAHRVNAIAGFQVPDDVRERMRERIYLDARRKALELKAAQALARPRGLIARLIGRDDEDQ